MADEWQDLRAQITGTHETRLPTAVLLRLLTERDRLEAELKEIRDDAEPIAWTPKMLAEYDEMMRKRDRSS